MDKSIIIQDLEKLYKVINIGRLVFVRSFFITIGFYIMIIVPLCLSNIGNYLSYQGNQILGYSLFIGIPLIIIPFIFINTIKNYETIKDSEI